MDAKYFTPDDIAAARNQFEQRKKELANFLHHAKVDFAEDEDGNIVNTEDAEVVSVETVRKDEKLLGG